MGLSDEPKKFMINVHIMPDDEVDGAWYLVCSAPPSPFPDSVISYCCKCAGPVTHRPSAPPKPRKICFPCFMHLFGQDAVKKPIFVTRKTVDEVAQLINLACANPPKKYGAD